MANSRVPGPIGTSGLPENLNDGSMARVQSPRPGPIGASTPPATSLSRPESLAFIPPRIGRQKTAASIQVLRQGSRGPEVEKLQRLLNQRLQPSPGLKADGVFGPVTLQALQQYQKAVGIVPDGMVSKETWYRLLKGDMATAQEAPMRPSQRFPSPPGGPTKRPGPIHTPRPQAAVTPAPGIWEWSLQDKFAEALRRTAPKLPESLRQQFGMLLTSTNLGIMAGSLVVWAGSHAFGFGEIVDIVLLVGGAAFLGLAVFDVAEELGDFLVVTSTAASEEDLDEAASHLARAIAIMGLAAFIAMMAKLAKRRGGGGRAAGVETAARVTAEPPPRPKSSPNPQPQRPQPKPPTNAQVKFGKRGRYTEPGAQPPTEQLRQEMRAAKVRGKLPAPEKAGWPKIPSREAATFKKPPEPAELHEGTKLYRVIDSESNPNGSYWTTTDPRTISEAQWRSGAAVMGEWNGDGAFVEYEIPKGGMKVWSGEAAPQMSSDGVNMLGGGGSQVWVPAGTTRASAPISTEFVK